MVESETYFSSELSEFAPHFLAIGAMRAGTTTLHNALRQLEGLSLPRMKETDFFIESKNWDRGIEWYRNLFDSEDHLRRGEVSPNYAKRDVFPEVAGHVARFNPDIRLIYIVRDPVERALSHYKHTSISTGDVPKPGALAGSWAEKHILATSRYAWQLENWLEHFDLSQILVIDFDRFVGDTLPQIQAVARHIDVDVPSESISLSEDNSSNEVARMPRWWHALRNTPVGMRARAIAPTGLVSAVKSKLRKRSALRVPELPDSVRERFAEELSDDAAAFRRLVGQRFPHWSV